MSALVRYQNGPTVINITGPRNTHSTVHSSAIANHCYVTTENSNFGVITFLLGKFIRTEGQNVVIVTQLLALIT